MATRRLPGVKSNGDTVWVVDSDDPRIYAYDLAVSSPTPESEIALAVSRYVTTGCVLNFTKTVV